MSEPYNYENHVAFISALRQSGKLDKLREARENLNKLFPLLEGTPLSLPSLTTTEQWLEWLEDDQRFATSDDEKAQLVSLYQRALKEYQCTSFPPFSFNLSQPPTYGFRTVTIFERPMLLLICSHPWTLAT